MADEVTTEEITDLLNHIEKLWLENCAAKKYLKTSCGVSDPTRVLAEEVRKMPADSLFRTLFLPVRQAIGQGLQDSESFEKLHKVLLESQKRGQD